MKRVVAPVLGALLICAAASPADFVSPVRIDAALDGALRAGAPGCAVGVRSNGAVAYTGARGSADLDYALPLTADSVFYIASDSKEFTGFSIALLADRGVLQLDDPITKWIPELPPSVYGGVTIGDLIHHTGGVRDYWGLLDIAGVPSELPLTQAAFLRLMVAQRSLNFQPGTRFEYSNSGYALLGIVVARASGKPLPEFAATEIFTPLGMTHTSYEADHLLPLPGRAAGYDFIDGAYRLDASTIEPLGDGGVRTTVGDMLRWLANLEANRLGTHPDAIAQVVRAPGKTGAGKTVAYAFGLGMGSRDGHAMFDHTGSFGGYESFVALLPELRLGVVALCNATGPEFSAWTVGLNVVDLYLGRSATPQPSPSAPAIRLQPQELAAFEGTFTEPDGTVWQIESNDGGLVAHVQALTFALQPIDATHVRAVGAPQPLEIAAASGLTLRVGNAAAELLKPFTAPVLDASQIRQYTGTYYSVELNLSLRVYAQEHRLYVARDLAQPELLGPIGQDNFTIGPRTLRFERNQRGTVDALILSADGVDALRAPKTSP
jgi:CubicO group peptidase (beta-lactamase class C family)